MRRRHARLALATVCLAALPVRAQNGDRPGEPQAALEGAVLAASVLSPDDGVVLPGLAGPLEVHGQRFELVMPGPTAARQERVMPWTALELGSIR